MTIANQPIDVARLPAIQPVTVASVSPDSHRSDERFLLASPDWRWSIASVHKDWLGRPAGVWGIRCGSTSDEHDMKTSGFLALARCGSASRAAGCGWVEKLNQRLLVKGPHKTSTLLFF
jgi:hypothetical protein